MGDVADLLTGFPFESKSFTDDGILLVRGMNVKRGYLDTSRETSEYWANSKGVEQYLLEDGDILIQMDGALIGKSYARITRENLPALLVQRVTRLRSKQKNLGFLYQSIQRDFLNYIQKSKTETAVPHLSLTDIQEFLIHIPSVDEQAVIAAFFDTLENLITLHQRKLDLLKRLKQAYLQKLFPKKDASVPAIRFRAYSGHWDMCRLSELESSGVIKMGRGEVISKKDIEKYPGNFPVYSSSAVGEGEFGRYGKYQFELPQITWSIDGGGKFFLRQDPKYSITNVSGWMRVKSTMKLNLSFLYYQLTDQWNDMTFDYTLKAHPSVIRNLYRISIPELFEQEIIGTFFADLDRLITLHQQRIDLLKQKKQYYLQQLFV